jgi:hypothetical protein
MGVHLSIKAKLVLPASAGQELKSTMEEFNRACNTLSELAFQQEAMGRYFCEYPQKDVNRPGAVRSSEKKRQVRNLKPQAPSTARPRA